MTSELEQVVVTELVNTGLTPEQATQRYRRVARSDQEQLYEAITRQTEYLKTKVEPALQRTLNWFRNLYNNLGDKYG